MNVVRLSMGDEQQLRDHILDLSRLLGQLDLLEQCGRDCQELRRRAVETRERLERLVRFFGSDAENQVREAMAKGG